MQRFLMTSAFLALTAFAAGSALADDASVCTAITAEADSENKAAPAKLDEVTTETAAVYDCAAKTFEAKFQLSLATTGLPSGWQDRLANAWSQPLCADPTGHEAVAGGWTLKATYKFTDGSEYATVAKCP
jgi:hypothetical protein